MIGGKSWFSSVEQWWRRSDESVRLPPVWPGLVSSGPVPYVGYVFVVGSRPCSKGFSLGSPVFLPPALQKTNIFKSHFYQNWGPAWKLAFSLSTVVCLFYLIFFLLHFCLSKLCARCLEELEGSIQTFTKLYLWNQRWSPTEVFI